MKTVKNILTIWCCLIVKLAISQDYIPYYPADWKFKHEVDLVDFSQVKSLTTQHLTVDEGEEYPVYETYMAWNNTYQLTDYQFVNYNNSYADFDVKITYVNPNGNQLKSVKIINSNTLKPLEEWQYTNGSFDVEKISVKRYLLNVAQPDVFEVRYEGNDDDFIQETIYTPEKIISKQTKQWFQPITNGNYKLIQKTYLDKDLILDQTDSIILNHNQKKLVHNVVNLGITSSTKYQYQTKQIQIAGDEYNYDLLERIQKDGKDAERYEYEFDAKGNWIKRKIYQMKSGKWEYSDIIKRKIDYKN